MEIVTSNEAKNEATPRHGWFYAGKLALVSLIVLLTLVTLKLLTEHRLAPKNAGLQGALAQPRLDLLLIGSSHTRKSYDMRLLERETGISSSFLISYDNADLSTMAQMLDTMAATLDRCPRHVVVEAYSAMLGRAPDLQDPRYFLDAPPSLKLRIIQSYFANHKSPGGVLDLFDLVVNRGNDEIVSYPVYIHALKMASYKGGRTDFYFPGMTAEAFRNLQAKLNGTDPDPSQVAALNHILDLAALNHFQVLFIDTPMPRPVISDPRIQALKLDFQKLLAARGAIYIDGDERFPVDDPSLFSDSNHLSSEGRTEFTHGISGTLKAWVASGSASAQ